MSWSGVLRRRRLGCHQSQWRTGEGGEEMEGIQTGRSGGHQATKATFPPVP